MMTQDAQRAALQAVQIFVLMEHARKAGCQFRNGIEGGKAAIIDLVLSKGVGETVLDSIAGRVNSPVVPPVAPTTHRAPVEAPIGPVTTPTPTTPPTTPEAPMHAPQTSQTPAQPVDSLADAIRRAIGPVSVTPEQIVAIVQPMIDAAIINMPAPVVNIVLPPPLAVKTILGRRHREFDNLLHVLNSGLHVLMVGPAGTGKTQAAQDAAEALSLPFFTVGAMSYSHEINGYRDANGKTVTTIIREACESAAGAVLLIDEGDASAAEAFVTLNSLLANGYLICPDKRVIATDKLRIIMATNTDGSGATEEFTARQRLDGASLSRFVTLRWDIDPAIEEMMAGGNKDWLRVVRAIRAHCEAQGIKDSVDTPRATKYGATLLLDPFFSAKRDTVLAMVFGRGALWRDWNSVKAIPAVAEFLSDF